MMMNFDICNDEDFNKSPLVQNAQNIGMVDTVFEELVSDKQALSLYKSFVDPQSNKQYPFMFLGPISPLSFTGSPLFIQMFTEFNQFKEANKLVEQSQGNLFNQNTL